MKGSFDDSTSDTNNSTLTTSNGKLSTGKSAPLTRKAKAELEKANAVPDVVIQDNSSNVDQQIRSQAIEIRDEFYAQEDAVVTDRVNEVIPAVIQTLIDTSPERIERKTREAAREVAEDWQEKFRDYSEKLDTLSRQSSARILSEILEV